MDNRKEVSVFKSILWCLIILILSALVGTVVILIWGFIIGWLKDNIGFIHSILSNKLIFYIFMTATSADIGRRIAGYLMRLFAKPMEQSKNIGKGFLGAGILLAIFGVITVIICIIFKTTFLDLTLLTIGAWYIGFGKISESDNDSLEANDNNENIADSKEDDIPVYRKRNDYSENTIIDYANLIRENYNFGELPKDEVIYFVKNIILPAEKDGKAVALANFFEFRERLYSINADDAFVKSSFYLGVLNANGIISEDEMNKIGDQFVNSHTERYLRDTKVQAKQDLDSKMDFSQLPVGVVAKESDVWKNILANMENPLKQYILNSVILRRDNTFGVLFNSKQLADLCSSGPKYEKMKQYFQSVLGSQIDVKALYEDENGEIIIAKPL